MGGGRKIACGAGQGRAGPGRAMEGEKRGKKCSGRARLVLRRVDAGGCIACSRCSRCSSQYEAGRVCFRPSASMSVPAGRLALPLLACFADFACFAWGPLGCIHSLRHLTQTQFRPATSPPRPGHARRRQLRRRPPLALYRFSTVDRSVSLGLHSAPTRPCTAGASLFFSRPA